MAKIWILMEASYYDSQCVVGVTADEATAKLWESEGGGHYWTEEYEVDGSEVTNNWRLQKLRTARAG